MGNPTVMIVVDRIDLDTQIASTFYAADAPNLVKAETRTDLESMLAQDMRKIIITTIFKFGEAEGVLNDRDNIILLVDEAHRTQEGDLGRKMRDALPNAFMFGLTGTPIKRSDRNTFYAFGSEEDENGYMSRYGFDESIRDGATKELHFEPRMLKLHIDQKKINELFEEATEGLTDKQRDPLAKTAAKMAVISKHRTVFQKYVLISLSTINKSGTKRFWCSNRYIRPRKLRHLQRTIRYLFISRSVNGHHDS